MSPKDHQKTFRTNKFNEVKDTRLIQKSVPFLYTNTELSEREILKNPIYNGIKHYAINQKA